MAPDGVKSKSHKKAKSKERTTKDAEAVNVTAEQAQPEKAEVKPKEQKKEKKEEKKTDKKEKKDKATKSKEEKPEKKEKKEKREKKEKNKKQENQEQNQPESTDSTKTGFPALAQSADLNPLLVSLFSGQSLPVSTDLLIVVCGVILTSVSIVGSRTDETGHSQCAR